MEIISRKEAIARGLKRYFTGKPCPSGHISEHNVAGGCVVCRNADNAIRMRKWRKDNQEEARSKDRARARHKSEEYKKYQFAYRQSNKCKIRECNRKYEASHRDSTHKWRLKTLYGMSPDDYNRMLANQKYVCAICKTLNPGSPKNKHWHVDHDHVTGVVRGLLCHQCNVMLGNAKDDPSVLRAAAEYLLEAARCLS